MKINFQKGAFPYFKAETKIWNKFDTEIFIEFSEDKTFLEEEKKSLF